MKKISTLILALVLLLSSCAGLVSPAPVTSDGLTVTFFDVGQADATLIECDGMTMLIDGGNASDSNKMYAVLKEKNITHLDYIVATHPHADHIGGLAGALEFASVGVVYSPVAEYDTRTFSNFLKAVEKRNAWLTIPNPPEYFNLGEALVEVLGPVTNLPNDPNNSSIPLKITYGSTAFLFTGDAEREAEQELLDRYSRYNHLSSTVYKVGHHGSNTSTTYPFLREIMPKYAVISCGRDNSYGHPHNDTLSRLRDADVTVYRTDMQGDIICRSDGTTVTFTTRRNADAQTNPTVPDTEDEYYIGNKNSLKFHRPSCSSLPAEHNQIIFDDREIAVAEGYEPCGSCNPLRFGG